MARTKTSEKAKKFDYPGSMIIDPHVPDESPKEDGDAADLKKLPSSTLRSETKLFTNLFRRVDTIMSAKLDCYHKLSLYHTVPGKGKRSKKQSIVRTLLEEENCNFEMFVKSIQRKFPWKPNCVSKRDIRTIALAADAVGWEKLLKKKFVAQALNSNKVSKKKPSLTPSLPRSLSKFQP